MTLLERVLGGGAFQDMPGAIRQISDIPRPGKRIVILSAIELVDDCAYRIMAKDVAMESHNQYLRLHALIYTPGRAAHMPGVPIILSYQTLGIVPTILNIRNPLYATMRLEAYQELCRQGIYEPKGESGRIVLQL